MPMKSIEKSNNSVKLLDKEKDGSKTAFNIFVSAFDRHILILMTALFRQS